MPVKIVDEESQLCMIPHPCDASGHILVLEMMAEKGIENDVRWVGEHGNPVIGNDPYGPVDLARMFPRIIDAFGVDVDAGDTQPDMPLSAPACDGAEVIATAAADLAYVQILPSVPEPFESAYRDRMSTQPGVDDVQFMHVAPYLLEGDASAVKQLGFV